MHRSRLLVLLSFLVFAVGCSLVEDDEGSSRWVDTEAPIQTDQTVYTSTPESAAAPDRRRYTFSMKARYRNPSDFTLYVQTCREASSAPIFSVVTVSSDTTQSGYNPFWACPAASPIPLAPGDTRIDTLEVFGPVAWDGETNEPLGVLEGDFRLVYDVSPTRDGDGKTLPDRQRRSNPFTIEIEE